VKTLCEQPLHDYSLTICLTGHFDQLCYGSDSSTLGLFCAGHDQWRLYEYIVQHFLATLSPDCTYLHTEIVFQVGDESFRCSGNSPLIPGYTEVHEVVRMEDYCCAGRTFRLAVVCRAVQALFLFLDHALAVYK